MLTTSQSLLGRLHDRDDGLAWRRLLAIYEPWLRGWLSRHKLQPADVDDVLQDILAVVGKKLPEFVHSGQPGAFRAWLRTILTLRVRDFLRGQRTRTAIIGPVPTADWLAQLEDPNSELSREWDREHDEQLIRRALAGIRGDFHPTTWEVFEMLVLEDRPANEVALRFSITANAVYVAKSRVLARLRQELHGIVDTEN